MNSADSLRHFIPHAALCILPCALLLAAHTARAADWTYSSAAVTDGNWTIPCTWNASTGALSLKAPMAGSGVLDLRDMSVGGVAVRSLSIANSAFASAAVTDFYAGAPLTAIPKQLFNKNKNLVSVTIEDNTLTSIGDSAFTSCSKLATASFPSTALRSVGYQTFYNCTALKADIMDLIRPTTSLSSQAFQSCPGITGDLVLTGVTSSSFSKQCLYETGITGAELHGTLATLPSKCFCACSKLKNVTLDLQGLTTISDNTFYKNSALTQDIAEIVPPSCRTIGNAAFWQTPVTGKLTMTNAASIERAFYKVGVSAGGMTELHLGGTRPTLYIQCFQSHPIRKVTLDVDDIAFGVTSAVTGSNRFQTNTTFYTSSSITNFVFWRGAISRAMIDDMLLAHQPNLSASNPNRFTVSKYQAGWLELAQPLTDAEKAYAPPKTFGVYATRTGARKAFLVHQPSPRDRRVGTILLVQ